MFDRIINLLPPAQPDAHSIGQGIDIQIAADKRTFERAARAAGASRMQAVKLTADYFEQLDCTQIDCTQSNKMAQCVCRLDNPVPVDACTTVIDGPDGKLPKSAARCVHTKTRQSNV